MDAWRALLLCPLMLCGISTLGLPAHAAPGLTVGLYLPPDMKCSDIDWMTFYGNSEDAGPMFIDEGHRFDRADKARITGAASFTADGTRYRLCPESSLKPDARTWRKRLHKTHAGLPIKPGLYRAYVSGKPNDPNADGCGTTGYVLFEPTRYAAIGYRGNQVERIGGVRQVGHRLFERTGAEGGWPFLVVAPDRFFMFEGECGDIEFRPANPRSVPRARMPRW